MKVRTVGYMAPKMKIDCYCCDWCRSIRHNKRVTRLNHRGRAKVNTQWNLYCMVHNIEKLAKTGLGQTKRQ